MLGHIVEQAIQTLPAYNDALVKGLGWQHYIKEYQTLMLGVPRTLGKTTFIKSMENNMSALAFYKYGPDNRSIETHDPYRFRGRNNRYGPKYTCILLDEYKTLPDSLFMIITELKLANMITSTPFILGLYTP